MVGNHVESCIFIAPTHKLPPRNWLARLFASEVLDEDQRRGLLMARPPQGEDDCGRIICTCFGVGVNTITQTIKEQNLTSVAEISKALKAGTNCGSCLPELKSLLSSWEER